MDADTQSSPETGTQVVFLTDKALEMVKAAKQREALGEDHALRLGVVGGGCSGFSYTMSFDNQQKPDDRVVEVDGVRILVDAASLEYIEGTTLDYVAGLHGAGFRFENPKAQRTCGCGSSFSA